MEDVLQVVSLHGFFRVKQLEEFLDELRSHEDFQLPDLDRLVNNELQEKFVDTLQVRPGRVNLFLLVDTRL
jgi:hypothetical protein